MSRNACSSVSKRRQAGTGRSSRKPWVAAQMVTTCFSTGMGTYWGCLRISTRRWPRLSWARVALSRSEPNWEKAASSRYWASSSLMDPATDFMAFTWAAPPTRETEMPTFRAGRTPALNRSDSRKIWPSVMEMTLVGM